VIYDRDWASIERFERPFGGGWLAAVPGWEAAALRPDRYVRVGTRWSSRNGCVRRGLGGFPPAE
jgi:hypothetical protein